MSAQKAQSWLIQGGTVVDGSGSPAYPADVRICDGLIVEIGTDLNAAIDEKVLDAADCIVSPGFIETHTHFDAAIWWDPSMDPLPGFGVTTSVMGNCGFGIAPISDDAAARKDLVGIFSFFEDIPSGPFFSELPWDWHSWSEYKASMEKNVTVPTNYSAFVGHIALRLAVMGLDAWERAATAEEVERMASMLDEAMAAGALGMSSNLFDHDGENRPVPSLKADDAELRALFEVAAKYPDGCCQVIVDTFRSMTAPQMLQRVADLTEDLDLRVQWAGLPTLVFQRDLMGVQAPLVELHEKLKSEGRDFWTGFSHVSITNTIGIQNSLIFAQSNEYVWNEVVDAETDEAKELLLRDPAWRARAQTSWDNESFEFSPFRPASARQLMLMNSDNGVGPTNLTLGEYMEQVGAEHPSDAMAEWLLANGLESTVTMPPFEKDDDMVIRLLRDPFAVGNISDAGAHGQMLCGGGENIKLITNYVRDTGRITLEEAIHNLSGKVAKHFNFKDRGVLEVGKRADVTVFNMDEIQERDMKRVYDVPKGDGTNTWRWTRDAAPVRATLVNGVATFLDGAPTGERPGLMLRPG
ncbi:amidohydrolase family protein [Parahaliea maris]|uniref:Amidohydrolase family protein n=1 Tax=Parahaliea maris TaxID=2716870 RepID=A0A5C8ZQ60_9GAMM|nr:amidohydrolase family protein [Parahaliea maris]TXS89822.1 amidohydrolase family protein [Parahaliea maris]